MKHWNLSNLKNKVEVEIPSHEWCVLASKTRTDADGNDISVDDNDVVWSLISTDDGEYRIQDLEPIDMVQVLNLICTYNWSEVT